MAGDELRGFAALLVPAVYRLCLGMRLALQLAVEQQHGICTNHHIMGILGGNHGCLSTS